MGDGKGLDRVGLGFRTTQTSAASPSEKLPEASHTLTHRTDKAASAQLPLRTYEVLNQKNFTQNNEVGIQRLLAPYLHTSSHVPTRGWIGQIGPVRLVGSVGSVNRSD